MRHRKEELSKTERERLNELESAKNDRLMIFYWIALMIGLSILYSVWQAIESYLAKAIF